MTLNDHKSHFSYSKQFEIRHPGNYKIYALRRDINEYATGF